MQQPQQLHKCFSSFDWYDNGMNSIKKPMDVIIQSLGFKAGEGLEGYVREKLNKLTPNDQIVRANVTLFFWGRQKYPGHLL